MTLPTTIKIDSDITPFVSIPGLNLKFNSLKEPPTSSRRVRPLRPKDSAVIKLATVEGWYGNGETKDCEFLPKEAQLWPLLWKVEEIWSTFTSLLLAITNK